MLYQTSTHDLFSDAFFILNNRLMFASLYGRDANVLSLLAKITTNDLYALGFREEGSDQYHPINTTAKFFCNLHKRVTKINTHHYGVLINAFMYDGQVVEFNLETKSAWIIMNDVQADIQKQVWRAISSLTDIPLLDSWANVVLAHLKAQESIKFYQPGITAEAALVGIQACHIHLPEAFDEQISHLIKTKELEAA